MSTSKTNDDNRIEPRRPNRRFMVVGFAVIYLVPLFMVGDQKSLIIATALLFPMIWLSIVDIERLIIPDSASVIIALIGCISFILEDISRLGLEALVALLVFAAGWFLGEVYFKLRDRDGFGLGDAKLLSACCLCIGFAHLWVMLLIASLGGITALLLRILRGLEDGSMGIPFGPYIAYSTYLVFILTRTA